MHCCLFLETIFKSISRRPYSGVGLSLEVGGAMVLANFILL